MIQVEPFTSWKEYDWLGLSKKELEFGEAYRERWLAESEEALVVSIDNVPLALCGWGGASLLDDPYFWCLLTTRLSEASPSELRALTRQFDARLSRAQTLVEEGNERAARFASFFKFYPLATLIVHGETQYRLYRRK